MASPPEALRRCCCHKCLAEDSEGRIVTAKAYREHQKKRPLEASRFSDLFDPPLPPDINLSPIQAIPPKREAVPPQEESSSLVSARLELQGYRYDVLSLWTSFQRPRYLEFASRPKTRLTRSVYHYRGVFNQPPYDLIQCPANSPFLATERTLHELAQQLIRLRTSTEWDHNFELQIQSAEKEVVSFLNEMLSCKIDLFHQIPESASSVERPLVIDTTRYLPFFEEGDSFYNKYVLSGLLLVLVLHLMFNGSQALCEVVLALLHDQVDILGELIGEAQRVKLSKSIPLTVKGVLPLFDLDPVVSRFLVCPQCYDINPLKSQENPTSCSHKSTPTSNECGARLVRKKVLHGKEVERPIREYVHQSLHHWLARFICRPDIEDFVRRQKEEYRQRHSRPTRPRDGGPALVCDILDSKAVQEFAWPDGKAFYDCADDEYRLFFSFSVDGFNANMNREAKATTTSTGIYLFCLNLPLEERQKPHNIYLAGVIPGPDKPSTSQINKYVDLVVDEFLPLYKTGARYSRTHRCPQGALARAAVMPVVCDSLGGRQVCGYGAVTSRFFCTFCWLPLHMLENFDKSSWPARDLEIHRHWANAWKDADSEATQAQIFDEHGIRYTPLLRLPYFNPITFTLVDTMHTFFLLLLQRHCRFIWGMNFDIADGDGALLSRKKGPTEPSISKMRAARKALEFNDVQSLTKTNKHVLFYLCLELDLRRGGKKRDLIRELLRWRGQQGAFLPRGWRSEELEVEHEQDGPVATTQQVIAPPPIHAQLGGSFIPVTLPAEVSAELVEAGESAFSRELKLDGIKRDVLWYMCTRRNLPLPDNPQKKDMIFALHTWKGERAPSMKREKHKMTVVLGRAVLREVAADMQRGVLPRWVDPAPIRAGQKKQGKLSADQWRSLCSIHLVVTLIRLWGREPEESRWHKMLANFLDLVTAVELGSRVVTSSEHTKAYETIMTRYLVQMKELYKEAVVVPSHHLALHVPDFVDYWGPSPQSRGFGWERANHTLQQINTNKRFGDMEKSYMFTFTRASNLLSLLSLEKIRGVISKTYAKVQKIINSDARGTRVHDLHNTPSTSGDRQQSGKSIVLEPHVVTKLTMLLASEDATVATVYPSATLLSSIKQGGTTYRPFNRSFGDSNVLLPARTSLGYQPARIQSIFSHRRVVGTSIREESFLLVALLKPLSAEELVKDWFRKYGRIGGSLWSTQYDADSANVQVIRASSLISHFACTALEATESGFDKPTYHVLPLDRLKTQIEEAGEVVKDMAFEDILGGVEDDDSDEVDTDDDMEVDEI